MHPLLNLFPCMCSLELAHNSTQVSRKLLYFETKMKSTVTGIEKEVILRQSEQHSQLDRIKSSVLYKKHFFCMVIAIS